MSWSLRVGKWFGIEVRLHFTFLLLLGFIGLSHWLDSHQLGDVLLGVGFFSCLFGCVLLHEFGHALMARKFGIRTRDITLLPIGGVARLERIPEKPMQEFWVALAGPAVNVVIAAVILFGIVGHNAHLDPNNLRLSGASFLVQLAAVNIFLAIFNMLPAFPMDGGRVFRALLATRMDYARATFIAARLGQLIAIVLAFLGMSFNPLLVFIALFVWIGAAQESSLVQMRSVLHGLPVQQVMTKEFRWLNPSDPLTLAVEHTLAGFQQDFPVLDAERKLVGMLTRTQLISALAQQGPQASVGEVMQQEFPTAEALELAERVLERWEEAGNHSMPVLHQQRLVGMLTLENLGEFLLLQNALRTRNPERVAATLAHRSMRTAPG